MTSPNDSDPSRATTYAAPEQAQSDQKPHMQPQVQVQYVLPLNMQQGGPVLFGQQSSGQIFVQPIGYVDPSSAQICDWLPCASFMVRTSHQFDNYIIQQNVLVDFEQSKIRYSAIETYALSTCRGYLVTGNIVEKPFAYLRHSCKIYQIPKYNVSSTLID
ncbi:unnamed protein product [Adineta steineri]|uniref:Uncharacterized protein n=1 Tax=Adineta steineri TaxID=433720 RepID=A0A815NZZ4_9BILA|nr:unnamed protein product [Adineta steineri]